MKAMPARKSMRSNFAWTFAGNVVYAAGQWAILSLFAKLGSSEMLGEYALALAVTAPVIMLTHLNLRAVLATDAEAKYPIGDYVALRLAVSAVGILAIAALAFAGWRSRAFAVAVVAAGVAQSSENVSDIYYGALQRRERMDRVAWSMMARAVLSVAALGVALFITRSLLTAVTALALARLAVLLAYDRPAGKADEPRKSCGWRARLAILRTALPLGLVLMLVSLNSNLPRYAIERRLGTRELGAFAAVASFMTAGNTVINALGQAATARMARFFRERDWSSLRRLVARLFGIALALGLAGVAGAVLLGKAVLRLVYRPEYESYGGLLVAVMLAAMVVYLAAMLGFVITSARAFDAQLPLFCAVALACAAAAWTLVPRFGLYGAPIALAIAAAVQIAGELLILGRALRGQEPAK
jgi:O-antigen/teichoic acid export membrane protein